VLTWSLELEPVSAQEQSLELERSLEPAMGRLPGPVPMRV
jgi:hypothetical protein